MMKTFGMIFLLAVLVSGCATIPKSTVETRKTERASAYAALTSEQRALVDQGHIKIGMPEDAVFIAWGQPSQVQSSETAGGPVTTWIYTGTGYQEQHRWNYSRYGYGGYYGGRRGYGYVQPLPTLEYEYIPYRYTAAEVVFEKGLVKSWKHTSPPPVQ